jgi:hypothetical protein
LEQVQEAFDETVERLCGALGFEASELCDLRHVLKRLDLSQGNSVTMPQNVTRNSPEAVSFERMMLNDGSFVRLFSEPARDMGFDIRGRQVEAEPIIPDPVVEALLSSQAEVSTSWQAAERSDTFMRGRADEALWSAYALQVAGCGHLMMRNFIQQVVDMVDSRWQEPGIKNG